MKSVSLVILVIGALALDCGICTAIAADANETRSLTNTDETAEPNDANATALSSRLAEQDDDIRSRKKRITVLTGAMLLIMLLVAFFALAIVLRSGSRWK